MSNWTLSKMCAKVKFFLRPINQQLYQFYEASDEPIIDLINDGIADLCTKKAPYTLWSPTEALTATRSATLDSSLLSVKRVEILTSLTDTSPHVLRRPEDYNIHQFYLEFTSEQTGILRVLATKRPALLALAIDADAEATPPVVAVPEGVMPFGSPYQLAVVYYAVSQLALTTGTNAGLVFASQFMSMFTRIKDDWEHETMNEHITLRGQDDNPANDGLGYGPYAEDPQGRIDSET